MNDIALNLTQYYICAMALDEKNKRLQEQLDRNHADELERRKGETDLGAWYNPLTMRAVIVNDGWLNKVDD